MQPSKRQRIQEDFSYVSSWIPVIEYFDCNDALKMRCVARGFIEPANCRLDFLIEKTSSIQAYNLAHAGFLSPKIDASFPCTDLFERLAFLHKELQPPRLFVTPFMKVLVQWLRDSVSHIGFTIILLNDYGNSYLGPELFKLSECLPNPKMECYVSIAFSKPMVLHDNWSIILQLPSSAIFISLIRCVEKDSLVHHFPLFCRTAFLSSDHFASFFNAIAELPTYCRKKLQWSERNCEMVRQARNVKYCIVYLEFFAFTSTTALQWLRFFWTTGMYLGVFEKHIPIMLDYAFADGKDWVLAYEDDFYMVREFLRRDVNYLRLDSSESAYKKADKILQMHRWPGPECRITE